MAKLIIIYGVTGCGKSYMIHQKHPKSFYKPKATEIFDSMLVFDNFDYLSRARVAMIDEASQHPDVGTIVILATACAVTIQEDSIWYNHLGRLMHLNPEMVYLHALNYDAVSEWLTDVAAGDTTPYREQHPLVRSYLRDNQRQR
jgi:hypothetical protein